MQNISLILVPSSTHLESDLIWKTAFLLSCGLDYHTECELITDPPTTTFLQRRSIKGSLNKAQLLANLPNTPVMGNLLYPEDLIFSRNM